MNGDGRGPSGGSEPSSQRTLQVRELGLTPYAEAVELQASLVVARREGRIPDQLLLVEHPPVITMGSAASLSNVLVNEDERRVLGVELHETGRGGDVTIHEPGQLVGYPILDLKPDRKDLHRYLRDLEVVLIEALAEWRVRASRREGLTGVWVGEGKVAAIGVRVSSGWITSHGFALNVRNDLRYFDTIVPCGIPDEPVTSLAHMLGRDVSMEEVTSSVVDAFCRVFGRRVVQRDRHPVYAAPPSSSDSGRNSK